MEDHAPELAGRNPRRTTITDVARAAGVSSTTVSFVYNGRRGVAAATRARVLAAGADLGWAPSAQARALSNSTTMTVGMIAARPADVLSTDPFFSHFLAGVESALSAQGYALLLQVVEGDTEAELASYERLVRGRRVDGLLLTDLRVRDPRLSLLRDRGLPTVVVGRPAASCPFPAVYVDDQIGVRQAVDHLVGLGHEVIAYVGGPSTYVHAVRQSRCLRRELTRHGLTLGPSMRGDFTAGGGSRATQQILRAESRATAIIYGNDIMAIAGMTAINDAGLSVPGDLSIVGLDETPLSAFVGPGLTSVWTDVVTWGQAAAGTLLSVIGGASPAIPTLTAPILHTRGSTDRVTRRRL